MLVSVFFILIPVVLGLSQPEQPSKNPVSTVRATCPRQCKPTCSTPNPRDCKTDPNCKCKPGNVWSDDLRYCIPISKCPTDLGCNGDKNATISVNPPPCPSTCKQPNELPCEKLGLDIGCVCKPGYILSEDGTCIKPDECPGGNPCGANQTFSYCKSGCLDYCPTTDSRDIIACDPIDPCPSGCVCQHRYRKKSYDDPRCILAEECSPFKCTRDYEEWDSCPSPCFTDDCSDAFKDKSICYTLVIAECYPQCVCKKDYARNVDGVCIPKEQCPKES